MEITSGMVKELRDRTNVGMMDCKKALQDSWATWRKQLTFCVKKALPRQ